MLNLEFWYTVAVFILFLEVSLTLLVVILLAAGVAYGSNPVRAKLKEYMPLAQQYSAKGEQLTVNVTGKARSPLIEARAAAVGFKATVKSLLGRP